VQVTSTVAEALMGVEPGEFDLIICDIGLPAGTGHDVIAGVRKRPPRRRLP